MLASPPRPADLENASARSNFVRTHTSAKALKRTLEVTQHPGSWKLVFNGRHAGSVLLHVGGPCCDR
jgi:hypothetical protein